MFKRSIADVNLPGRRVLMRVDFNVPVEDGQVVDDRRIRLPVDSIRHVLEHGGRLIVLSHLGRPEGGGFEPQLSLQPCARRLSELLGRPVLLAPDCVGPRVRHMVDALRDGQVLMLENLRFHDGEVFNAEAFARQLAELGNVYCNEAFAASHREHASLVALPRAMRDAPRVAGLQLEREMRFLDALVRSPRRPFVLVLGGLRVADKLGALLRLLEQADTILVGGAVACTLMAAEGRTVGDSRADADDVAHARTVLDAAGRHRSRLLLPHDHVCGDRPDGGGTSRVFEDAIPAGWTGLDIGPRTVTRYTPIIQQAKTILWNGPLGRVERRPFDVGTKMAALAAVHATLINQARSVMAGSSLCRAIESFGLATNLSHLSNGGAATLARLEGRPFASIDALEDAPASAQPQLIG